MRLRDTIWHEWRTTLSRPAALVSYLLLFCLLMYAALNGRMERDTRTQAIASHDAEVVSVMATWISQRKALDMHGPRAGVPVWAGSAMEVTLASSLPPAPLADFAIGQSDLLPYLGAVSLWDPDIRLFSRYELDDPVSLALGAFDLSRALILVWPLLLIVLSFDVLAADRDAGRLPFMVAQGARIRRMLWMRLSIRAVTLFAVMILVACIALIVPVPAVTIAERLPYFGLWVACAFLYGLFWMALISFVIAANRSSEVNLTALLLVWTGLTFLLPAGVAAVAEAVYPMPSRVAALADAREIEISTERAEPEETARFILDHPDMVVDDNSQMPSYVRTAFLATKAVDDATRPILLAFEQAAFRRERSLELMRYLSPAIAVYGVLVDIAGSSARRHRDYAAAARALKAEYAERAGKFIVAGQPLPLEEAAALPRVELQGERAGTSLRRHLGTFIVLALVTGALLLLADWRVRRVELSGR